MNYNFTNKICCFFRICPSRQRTSTEARWSWRTIQTPIDWQSLKNRKSVNREDKVATRCTQNVNERCVAAATGTSSLETRSVRCSAAGSSASFRNNSPKFQVRLFIHFNLLFSKRQKFSRLFVLQGRTSTSLQARFLRKSFDRWRMWKACNSL